MAAATASTCRSRPALPLTMKPTGALPGSWQGSVAAQPSRKLASPVLRMMRKFQRKYSSSLAPACAMPGATHGTAGMTIAS